MCTAAAHPDIAAFDAALAKGEGWLRLIDRLRDQAIRRSAAIGMINDKGRRPFFIELARLARAISLAVVLAIQLRGVLKALARRRALSLADRADAEAPATAQAGQDAAARRSIRDTTNPELAPTPILFAPWRPAPPTSFPPIAQDPPRRTTRAADIAARLAVRAAPNAPPWLPPRPG